ncbi:MAG TPA: patatin family protein [Lachnospiraceae bacterium]|nr:patatin family protein [Lachnospiraceae bacterium]
MYYQAGLVLEGGGMKGIYTAGVLEYFLEKELEFSSCYGVSAGSSNLCSYLSKQKGRAFHVVADYLGDKHYCSLYSLITTGNLFGIDMCYNQIPNKLNPYDYDTFSKYKGKAYAVVTNIETGEAEYLQLKDMHRDIRIIRASCSLPLVSRNVKIGDKLYLDGGMADSIPLRKSIEDGNQKNVVILTKEYGYIRKPSKHMGIMKIKYRRYPKLMESMEKRYLQYNETLKFMEKEEAEGRIFVIRPKLANDIERIEKDPTKLEELYQEGYNDAKECFERLLVFLNK